MASQPKKRRLLAHLAKLAEEELDEGGTPLDWFISRVRSGATVTRIARELAEQMGESVSRAWLSSTMNNIAPDASRRIGEARRESAVFHAEDGVEILDTADVSSREAFQRDKARADSRFWLAARFSPSEYGDKPVAQINVMSYGDLHIAALQARQPASGTFAPVAPSEARPALAPATEAELVIEPAAAGDAEAITATEEAA
jgi:hypothetical protein